MPYKPYPAYHSQQPYTPICLIRPITPSRLILPAGRLRQSIACLLNIYGFPIDGLLACKRPSFTTQNAVFCNAKDGILERR